MKEARKRQIRCWIERILDDGDCNDRSLHEIGQETSGPDYRNERDDENEKDGDDGSTGDDGDDGDDGDERDNDGSGGDDTDTTTSFHTEKLRGMDNDVLVPTQAQIDHVFQKGCTLWTRLVEKAKLLPKHSIPSALNDPSFVLQDVPALPEELPQQSTLAGRPQWKLSHAASVTGRYDVDDHFNFDYLSGRLKVFCLSYRIPITCQASCKPVSGSRQNPTTEPRGLFLLTLCWSYILSTRLGELQGRTAKYSHHALRPILAKRKPQLHNEDVQNTVDIFLGASASTKLIRWLCAILSPKPGWRTLGGDYAPWTALYSGNTTFAINIERKFTFQPNETPPSSIEATELLIELCNLYGFGVGRMRNQLSPVTAGFLAALTLPFYRLMDLQPKLTATSLQPTRDNSSTVNTEPVRQYLADIRYYMVLSMCPCSVGSIIWSIFWQPDIECNLVSSWLHSILTVLCPIIQEGHLDILLKAFALHRPQVALWWLGVFLLGSQKIPSLILRYLEKLEEQWGFGSMAPPDITVSAWIGSSQSFLDRPVSNVYLNAEDSVPVADLLRLRYNFRLQDPNSLLSWKPFGTIPKKEIEPELWPSLEGYQSIRTYDHWVWSIKKGCGANIQNGFRKDTGRQAQEQQEQAQEQEQEQETKSEKLTHEPSNLDPSSRATLRMIAYCTEDVPGDRDREISIIPGAKGHPWLRGWRGFD